VAQGVLALEARVGDPVARDLGALNDARAASSVAAERGFLIRLGGGCNVPLAALAEQTDAGGLRLRALLAAEDGRQILRHQAEGRLEEAASLGAAAAEAILGEGGDALLEALRAEEAR
jgi:hydroxymethylbilane synthase